MTLSDTISSLSQLSEHLIQLVDAQSIPIPPLLNGASVERFRNDDHVQTTVHQFQKHIKHIHSAQAILGRAVKTLEWHVNSVHNAKAAVSRLPVEVIDLIFKAGHQEPSHRSDLLYPLMISRVCRSWRAVALGSSWLWEWVSPHWPLPQILAWFNRVHQHPVSVWLELGIDDIWYSRDIRPFLEFPRIVQEHSNYRVLSISGYAGVRDGTSVIRNTFMEIQRIMKAETLILNSFGTLDSVIGDLEFVRHLFVQRCTIKPVQLMTMKFLISLSIHGGLLDDWWGILAHVSSTLETLILVDHLIGDENRDNRITLDNLQHLIIGQRDEELTFLSGIWKWIRTPGLRHLVVFSDWAIRLNTLGDDSDFVTNFLGLVRLFLRQFKLKAELYFRSGTLEIWNKSRLEAALTLLQSSSKRWGMFTGMSSTCVGFLWPCLKGV